MKAFAEKLPNKKDPIGSEKGELVKSGSFSISEKIKPEDIFNALREIRKGKEIKRLAEVEEKIGNKEALSKDNLIFLYGTDIKGFSYERDPRIKEIIGQRNPEEDLLVIFGKDKIARNLEEINDKIEVYVGKLESDIFLKLQKHGIDCIYTSFPESRIQKMEVVIGGKNKKELIKELKEKKINIYKYAKRMMDKPDFATSQNTEHLDLVRLAVRDLFFDNKTHTIKEIYEKAEEFGLEPCPTETGPNLRLQYLDQPYGEWIRITMKQITDSYGRPSVFILGRGWDDLLLLDYWADPGGRWHPGLEFVFVSRPSSRA